MAQKQILAIDKQIFDIFQGICIALQKEFLLSGIKSITLELPDEKESNNNDLPPSSRDVQKAASPGDFWQGRKIHGFFEGFAEKNLIENSGINITTNDLKIEIGTSNPLINVLPGKKIAVLICDSEVTNG